jgi:hypothetical protein
MTQEELSELAFIDVLFHQLNDDRTLWLICKNERNAQALYLFLQNTKHRLTIYKEAKGRYIIGLAFVGFKGLAHLTRGTKEDLPQLSWLETGAINYFALVWFDKDKKPMLVGQKFAIASPFHPN